MGRGETIPPVIRRNYEPVSQFMPDIIVLYFSVPQS
jgi:hypothetical protein